MLATLVLVEFPLVFCGVAVGVGEMVISAIIFMNVTAISVPVCGASRVSGIELSKVGEGSGVFEGVGEVVSINQ